MQAPALAVMVPDGPKLRCGGLKLEGGNQKAGCKNKPAIRSSVRDNRNWNAASKDRGIRASTSLLEDQLSRLEVTRKQSKALREIKESDVQSMLSRVAENLPELDRESLKDILRSLIDRITFDSSSPACCIHYKIKLKTGDFVASPGGLYQFPHVSKRVNFQISRLKRRA
ncbi:hypothetical protein SAMN05216404_106129 [Nitrosospira multiformis]|uniref:Uncharacterized protein n=1 Tax=Nitrosospira multiformis TaxID=1231 RepID=A0A1H8IMG0_9PROT|nr:hypothetical protein SAMN05216404_106129 [Nitrosospira multiformis]